MVEERTRTTSLTLDGRGRTSIARKGMIDDSEHKGSLFWLVARTSKPLECNLVFETVTWENKVSFNLPAKKKQKTSVDWDSSELPSIPILVNKKAIKKHTKLAVFQKDEKDTKDKKK